MKAFTEQARKTLRLISNCDPGCVREDAHSNLIDPHAGWIGRCEKWDARVDALGKFKKMLLLIGGIDRLPYDSVQYRARDRQLVKDAYNVELMRRVARMDADREAWAAFGAELAASSDPFRRELGQHISFYVSRYGAHGLASVSKLFAREDVRLIRKRTRKSQTGGE